MFSVHTFLKGGPELLLGLFTRAGRALLYVI